jgi:penicillin-binding protein 1C
MSRVALRGGLGLVATVVLCAAVASLILLPLPGELIRPTSQTVFDRRGEILRMYPTEDNGGMLRLSVSSEELPQHLVDALLTFEDKRFFWHFGIDPIAVLRSTILNLRAGRIVSGASTLTMQVARMIERRPRTFKSKVLEMLWAVKLEMTYSKAEILELYFNMAPYGGNIEGVGAASHLYFGKDISKLSIDESAILVAIPNQPNQLRPDRSPKKLRVRRNDVLDRMHASGLLSDPEHIQARALPIHARRSSIPNQAPHFTRWVRSNRKDHKLHTTLDLPLQRQAEKLLQDHLADFTRDHISNGSVVIIDNETRDVLAYIGSKNFFDATISGQVDGARGLRSPGSTLKPFVYAMALERGLIGVNSIIEDVPLRYPDWSPENFDGNFRGLVSAKQALILSLNIPPVRLAAQLEPDGLKPFLMRAGLTSFSEEGRDYGLSMVLGGCEVRLLELTNAYASLASLGEYRDLRVLKSQSVSKSRRILSKEASYLVSDILTDLTRPELADIWRETTSIGQLAWKTGTSYGRRDAWSIGYNRRYTVGVWIGNFDGRGAAELVGSYAAAPLLFRVFNLLPGVNADEWMAKPKTLVTRRICALSGEPVSPHCDQHRSELAIATAKASKSCRLHVSYQVDDESGQRLCSRCRSGRHYHDETHVVYPTNVTPWLKKAGFAVFAPPVHNTQCDHGVSGDRPIIHKPLDGDHFVIRNGIDPQHQEIAILASTEGGTGDVYWFLNGKLVSKVGSGETAMLPPTTGVHELMAVDSEGRHSSVQINISP